ncbi:MAG: putative Ig domain-containing protein [Marmoricola sp.]
MSRTRRFAAAVVSALLLVTGISVVAAGPSGATATATISGTLTDEAGNSLNGMALYVRGPNYSSTNFSKSGPNGQYSATLPDNTTYTLQFYGSPYPTQPTVYVSTTITVALSGNTVKSAVFPTLVPINVTVVDSSNQPASNVTVTTSGSSVPGQASDGQAVTFSSYAPNTSTSTTNCTPDASGTCAVPALLGATDARVGVVTDLGTYHSVIPVPTNPSSFTYHLPDVPSATLSGVITDTAGNPIPGMRVNTQGPNEHNPWTWASSDGTYSLKVRDNSSYAMQVYGRPYPNYPNVQIQTNLTSAAMSGNTVKSFRFPQFVPINVTTVDSNHEPLRGQVSVASSSVPGQTDDGQPLTYSTTFYDHAPSCTQDSSGTCSVPAFLGSVNVGVQTDTGYGSITSAVDVTSTSTSIDQVVNWLAVLSSHGSVPGTVAISVPRNLTLSHSAVAPVASSPDSQTAVVGATAYQVTGMGAGGSADVRISLPARIEPTGVYRLTDDGTTTDVTSSATITDNSISVHLVDGGVGDLDGIANGVVVDRLIPTGPVPVTVTTDEVPDPVAGEPYTANLTASGGTAPYHWSMTSGTLPAGLSMSPSGQISGTPTSTGYWSFTVKATDSAPKTANDSRSFPLHVVDVAVTTATLPGGFVNKAYSATLKATGRATPYTWSLVSGTLPSGVKLSTGGVISGTPTVTGSFDIVAQVKDNAGNLASQPYTLVIAPMTITTSSLPDAPVAVPYSATLAESGGKSTWTWSVTAGVLPAGLKLSAAGKITGSPTTPGTSTFTVKVQDSTTPTKRVATRQMSITVTPMTVIGSNLPAGLAGKAYPSTTLKTSGGKATFAWTISVGALPAGMTLSASGVIAGTPTSPGTSTFTVRVTDGSVPKNLASRQFTITVAPMSVITTSLPNGKVKTSYPLTTLKVAGGKGTLTWTVASGVLPPGLKLSTGGLISGTPSSAGTYTFTVRITDSSVPKNTASRTLVIVVNS